MLGHAQCIVCNKVEQVCCSESTFPSHINPCCVMCCGHEDFVPSDVPHNGCLKLRSEYVAIRVQTTLQPGALCKVIEREGNAPCLLSSYTYPSGGKSLLPGEYVFVLDISSDVVYVASSRGLGWVFGSYLEPV